VPPPPPPPPPAVAGPPKNKMPLSPVFISLEQAREHLARKRRDRDTAFELVNIHIETREKFKMEQRMRKADDDRAVFALVSSRDNGENEYVRLWQQLQEMRAQRQYLIQDKLLAINAREVSKAEIRQLRDAFVAYQKRMQIEVSRKRRNKKQVWQAGRFIE